MLSSPLLGVFKTRLVMVALTESQVRTGVHVYTQAGMQGYGKEFCVNKCMGVYVCMCGKGGGGLHAYIQASMHAPVSITWCVCVCTCVRARVCVCLVFASIKAACCLYWLPQQM